jgi:hypothetical protein
MSVTITHVRYGRTPKTESTMVRYKWRGDSDGSVGENDKPTMVDWIENKNGKAYVGTGSSRVNVGVVDANPKYLRTYADKQWTNNLSELPEF